MDTFHAMATSAHMLRLVLMVWLWSNGRKCSLIKHKLKKTKSVNNDFLICRFSSRFSSTKKKFQSKAFKRLKIISYVSFRKLILKCCTTKCKNSLYSLIRSKRSSGGVLWKRCSPATLLKRNSNTGVFL